MGDAKKKGQSSRKPVSLNDSHYRFLQELSTPRPPCPEEENPSMAKIRDGGCFTMPSFSLFADIDSPSQQSEGNQPTVKPADHTATVEKPQYCEEKDDRMPIFSLGTPFRQNEVNQYSVKPDGHTGTAKKPQYCGEEDGSKPIFSLGSPFEQNEVKQYPVKPDDHTATAEKPQYNGKDDDSQPTFSLGSPLEQNEAKENPLEPSDFFEDNCLPSSNETTDLIDLPKQIEDQKIVKVKIQGRRRLCKVTSTREDENVQNSAALDEPDFESPQRPTANNASEDGNEIRDILNDLSSRLGLLSIEKKRVPKKVDRVDESTALKEVKEVNEADLPQYASAGSSFSRSSGECDVSSDSIKRGGGSVEDNLVDEYEEREEDSLRLTGHEKKEQSIRQPKFVPREAYESLVSLGRNYISISDEEKSESKATNVVNRTHGTQNSRPSQKKSEALRVGQSSKSNTKEEEDNDCVVVSSTKVGKKGDKFIRKGSGTNVGNVLDVDNDEPVPEFEGSLTLRGQRSTYTLPGKIAKMLYPHQREGLRWLWSLHCKEKGGILGDDMGLGKTMQICGFLAGLFHSHLIKRALVVAPKTLLAHWVKELAVVGLSEKTREYYSTCPRTRQYELQYVLQDKGILLTTYDIVRNNVKSLRGDSYLDDESDDDGVMWDYMILDEGHLIKNPSTQRAKSLLEIPSPHRIIISGTPLQNNLKELWALFNFCCPELLGDKKWFKDKYEHFILRGSEKKASDRDKRVGSAVAKELRERIQPYFLRRLKSEVFNDTSDNGTAKLSKKNEIIVWLRLSNCQRQLYEAFLKSELVLSAFDGSPLAALTILKKICDHPLLLTKRAAEDLLEGMDSMLKPEDACIAEKLAKHIADVAEKENFEENHDNISCKISFIMSLLDNLIPNGHNVLIFSQTRKMLNLIQESLASSGYEYLRIDGTTKASDRVKIVDEFQGGNSAPIFLLTSQVGGLGLTLTNADRVIVVDPAWNPSMDNQSVDRAYRIGQKKDVLVYRLMTCGTVEEKIYRKQIFKGGLFKTATEHKEQIRYFSQQDLRELFSIPAQGFDVSLTQQQLHEEHDSQHKMDESLETNVQFLETLGIAGVSHHSLLFSKTAPVPVVQEEEKEEIRSRGTSMGYRSSSSSSSSVMERPVDGAEYAFNPKDVKLNKKHSPVSAGAGKLTESEIKDKIKRLALVYENKAMVSRLADKGEKIQKQISELNLELDKIKIAKRTGNQVIDLDCLTGELQKGLNL